MTDIGYSSSRSLRLHEHYVLVGMHYENPLRMVRIQACICPKHVRWLVDLRVSVLNYRYQKSKPKDTRTRSLEPRTL
jgi:hypothetical protein